MLQQQIFEATTAAGKPGWSRPRITLHSRRRLLNHANAHAARLCETALLRTSWQAISRAEQALQA